MKFLINLLVSAVAVLIAAYIVPDVFLQNQFTTALLVAVVLGLLNAVIGNILRFITAPLNFFTFGLISFLITVFMVMLVDKLIDSFDINGFLNTVIFSIVLAVINSIFGFLGLKK